MGTSRPITCPIKTNRNPHKEAPLQELARLRRPAVLVVAVDVPEHEGNQREVRKDHPQELVPRVQRFLPSNTTLPSLPPAGHQPRTADAPTANELPAIPRKNPPEKEPSERPSP